MILGDNLYNSLQETKICQCETDTRAAGQVNRNLTCFKHEIANHDAKATYQSSLHKWLLSFLYDIKLCTDRQR